MKKMFRFVFISLFVLLSSAAFVSCGNGSSTTTNTDSSTTTTTTTDTAGTMGKMGNSGSMKMMTEDSTKKDSGGRNTQDVPPPKPKK